jgi:hypothetical protein
MEGATEIHGNVPEIRYSKTSRMVISPKSRPEMFMGLRCR